MSVNVRVYRVFASEVESLRQATADELDRVLFGADGGSGWEMDPGRMLDLEKAWQAVNFVVATGNDEGTVSFLVDDSIGEAIDYEFTYAPGRLIEPSLVKAIAASIAALPSDTVESRLSDASSMNELYPFSMRSYEPQDREWISTSVSKLKAFVERSAKLDCALLVGSS